MKLTAYIDRANRWFFRLTDADGEVVADNASPIDDKTAFDVTADAPAASTPTLADVLAAGNDPDGTSIRYELAGGEFAEIAPSAAPDSAALTLTASDGDTKSVAFGPSVGASWSGFTVQIDGADMPAGQTLVGNPDLGVAVFGTPGAAELVITEDASGAAGTYSGSIVVPGGATITGMLLTRVAPFDNDLFSGVVTVGDVGDPGGYVTFKLSQLEDGSTVNLWDIQADDPGDNPGSYWATFATTGGYWKHAREATDHELLVGLVSEADTPPTTPGEFAVLVTWSLPPSSAATFTPDA